MKKRTICNIGIMCTSLLYFILFIVLVLSHNIKYLYIVNLTYMGLLVLISYGFLGFRKLKVNYINNYLSRIVFIYCIITLIIIYGMGLLLGFNKSMYSLNPLSILKYQVIPIIVIILMEIFRYIVIWANKDSKKTIVLYTLLITVFDVLITVNILSYKEISGVIMVVIPVIVKNILLSYLCYYCGYKTTIIYRLIMDCYLIVIPYTPKLPEIVSLLILVNLPILLFLKCNKIIEQRDNKLKPEFNTNKYLVFKFLGGTVVVAIIGLMTGLFPHYLVGIRSDSMEPKIYKGDAVILEKLNKDINIKKGDIISYKEKGSIIVHRVIDIKNKKYLTKGDNNNVNDKNELKRKDIKGIVRLRIPKVAWPTIWISELFKLKK